MGIYHVEDRDYERALHDAEAALQHSGRTRRLGHKGLIGRVYGEWRRGFLPAIDVKISH